MFISNLLLYDHSTESLWSQLKMQAVAGGMTGARLKPIPIFNTTWKDWKRRHPDTGVISLDTGYRRDYKRDPYQGYQQISRTYFPVSNINRDLYAKEWVLGVIANGKAKAYPFKILAKAPSPLPDRIGGKDIHIYFVKEIESAWVESAKGEILPSMRAYWFAWYAFYPETEVLTR